MRLYESDIEEDDEKKEQQNQIISADDGQPQTPETQPPVSDEKNVPLEDGSIPIDSTGISQGDFNALDPIGTMDVQFQSGNYNQLTSLPKIVSDKVQQITNTLVPLQFIALIELLGASNLFKQSQSVCNMRFENNQAFIDFYFQYTVDSWIANDVDQEAISNDANYVLNKIKIVPNASFTECTIDTSDGTLTIRGTI